MSQPPQPWTLAYLPLRPRSLAVQLGILVLAEIALYFSYADHDARFHWATHFLVALGFTALLLLQRVMVPGDGEGPCAVAEHLDRARGVGFDPDRGRRRRNMAQQGSEHEPRHQTSASSRSPRIAPNASTTMTATMSRSPGPASAAAAISIV